MELLAPRLYGPLSECSRSVAFEYAVPGASVILLRKRDGQTIEVGQATAITSKGIVKLDQGEEFTADDMVSGYQESSMGSSPAQADAIKVQKSEKTFNPPRVLTHLYECSRGFAVGAVRPGTLVEVLDGGKVIASGEATNGSANLRVSSSNGLPQRGTMLTLRQRICPKPTPPGGASEWIHDSALPPVEPLLTNVKPGGLLPAPKINYGLTDCSRVIQVVNVIPGAEVVVEDGAGAWWITSSPSDATRRLIELPQALVEGNEVEVRQELGSGCDMQFERRSQVVGPRKELRTPAIHNYRCHSTPTINLSTVEMGADIEFEVVYQGKTEIYRTYATEFGPFPAPPAPLGAKVRVRQGECNHWSKWSDPALDAKTLTSPVQKPVIIGDLIDCQNSVRVENIDPPETGILRVLSSLSGVIGKTTQFGIEADIVVAPSLKVGDEISIEHEVCGKHEFSSSVSVLPLVDLGMGPLREPLYDGDTSVTIEDVTSGAFLELWDQERLLTSGFAPSMENGKGPVALDGFGELRLGQLIYVKFKYCGHYRSNEEQAVPVVMRQPLLNEVRPGKVTAGGGDQTINAVGEHFRKGASIWFEGAGNGIATFISTSELRIVIKAYHFANPGTKQVRVRNPDGQVSAIKEIEIVAPPPPPPPPPPKAKLQLSINDKNNTYFSLVSVKWTVWRQEINGFDKPLFATGPSATIQPFVKDGQYHIHVEVWVKPASGENAELAEFMAQGQGPGGVRTMIVASLGVDRSQTFSLEAWEQDGFVNPVVLIT